MRDKFTITHPGGRWTTTAKAPCPPSSGAMGTVSTHRVNEPHRCTCGRGVNASLPHFMATTQGLQRPGSGEHRGKADVRTSRPRGGGVGG